MSKWRQANTELYLAKETSRDWPCFETWKTFMNLLKAEWKVNQQEGGEEFKCYTIWQTTVAMLHLNGQLRTERAGDTARMSKTCSSAENNCWYYHLYVLCLCVYCFVVRIGCVHWTWEQVHAQLDNGASQTIHGGEGCQQTGMNCNR